jgi:hypothetical protein
MAGQVQFTAQELSVGKSALLAGCRRRQVNHVSASRRNAAHRSNLKPARTGRNYGFIGLQAGRAF